MKHITSVKRELTNTNSYIATCEDTEGYMWALLLANFGKIDKLPVMLGDGNDLSKFTMSRKSLKILVKQLEDLKPEWWAEALEDYEEGDTPVTLKKETLEILSLWYSYDTVVKQDLERLK